MRRVTDVLEGYAFGVSLHDAPPGDPAATAVEIVFIDNPDNPSHTVAVKFTAAGKQRLLAQLTGGVIVA